MIKTSRFFSILFLVLLFGAAFTSMNSWAAPAPITIGFIPGDDPEWLKRNGVELAKALQTKIGVPVNVYISKDYNGLIEAMREKKVDFAFFSAMTFVLAESRAGAKVLMKKVWETPFYYSVILTTQKTKISSIGQLKDKKFGFIDEKSASGFLYPSVMLRKKKLDTSKFFKEIKFYGQHEAAVKALAAGEVDAIATYSDTADGTKGAWRKFAADRNDFKILWTSDPIPNDPFCVREDFYEKNPKLTHDLMFALIDFKDEPDDKNLLKKLYGIKGLELATSRQYDPVRELVKVLGEKIK